MPTPPKSSASPWILWPSLRPHGCYRPGHPCRRLFRHRTFGRRRFFQVCPTSCGSRRSRAIRCHMPTSSKTFFYMGCQSTCVKRLWRRTPLANCARHACTRASAPPRQHAPPPQQGSKTHMQMHTDTGHTAWGSAASSAPMRTWRPSWAIGARRLNLCAPPESEARSALV